MPHLFQEILDLTPDVFREKACCQILLSFLQDTYAVSHIAGETHLNYPTNASN
jgi:hypothetical protein